MAIATGKCAFVGAWNIATRSRVTWLSTINNTVPAEGAIIQAVKLVRIVRVVEVAVLVYIGFSVAAEKLALTVAAGGRKFALLSVNRFQISIPAGQLTIFIARSAHSHIVVGVGSIANLSLCWLEKSIPAEEAVVRAGS